MYPSPDEINTRLRAKIEIGQVEPWRFAEEIAPAEFGH
jgi:hypothetical protein